MKHNKTMKTLLDISFDVLAKIRNFIEWLMGLLADIK